MSVAQVGWLVGGGGVVAGEVVFEKPGVVVERHVSVFLPLTAD
jgi:hypothetical protein